MGLPPLNQYGQTIDLPIGDWFLGPRFKQSFVVFVPYGQTYSPIGQAVFIMGVSSRDQGIVDTPGFVRAGDVWCFYYDGEMQVGPSGAAGWNGTGELLGNNFDKYVGICSDSTGEIFALTKQGQLMRYHCMPDLHPKWSSNSPYVAAENLIGYDFIGVFADYPGIINLIMRKEGKLYWGRCSDTTGPVDLDLQEIDSGWDQYDCIACAPFGLVFARKKNGKLFYYQMADENFTLSRSKTPIPPRGSNTPEKTIFAGWSREAVQIGKGWDRYSYIFAGPYGGRLQIFGVTKFGKLYCHDYGGGGGYDPDGSAKHAWPKPIQIGRDW